jgi:hypothetical protein
MGISSDGDMAPDRFLRHACFFAPSESDVVFRRRREAASTGNGVRFFSGEEVALFLVFVDFPSFLARCVVIFD